MFEAGDLCTALYDLARKHNGENREVVVNGIPILIIQRFEDADYILRLNADNYIKNMAWFRQVMGPSRMSENGEAWQLRMEISQPYFSKFDRNACFAFAQEAAQDTIQEMAQASTAGATVLNDIHLRKLSATVALRLFFGMSIDEAGLDLEDLAEMMEYGSQYAFVPRGETNERYQQTISKLPALRHRVLKSLEKFRTIQADPNTMLADLQAAQRDKTNGFTQEHELVTLFAASTETTGASLGWACYLLAKYPDIQQLIRNEVRALRGAGQFDWEHIKNLRPLQNFISETLRLYPPTPVIAKLAVADDMINGIPIKAHQNILVSFVGIQMDQRMRRDPWQMDISDTYAACPVSGRTTSFSMGPRICGGKHFALVELAAFICTFVERAELELTSDAPPHFLWKSQMLHKGGQPVRISTL
ncbi:cytochrome P450 [Microvirga sp. W0021]|uniref:Cytochrome P450 n=1 Tax=Hohaiivirga grylli TaxID=3133970 RepID=A0ABV0BGG0_9HYPH